MKKLIIGIIILLIAPFTVLFGSLLICAINAPQSAVLFASALGTISILFNVVIGGALIIRGHQEIRTFSGW